MIKNLTYGFLICLIHILSIVNVFASETDSLLNIISAAKEDTTKVKALNDLGWYFRNKGDVQLSIHYLQQAQKLAAKINYVSGEAKALNRLGVSYGDRGDYKMSLALFKNSLAKRSALKDIPAIASVLNNMALIYQYTGDYPNSIKTHNTSLKLRTLLKDTVGMAVSYLNLGLVYKLFGDYDKALDYGFKSLQINEQLRQKQGQAIAMAGIGRIYREIKNYSKAKEYLVKCKNIFESIGDKRGVAESNSNLGTLLHVQDKDREAIYYFLKSSLYNKDIENKMGLSTDYENIGNCYFNLKKIDSAIFYNKASLQLSIEMKDNEGICLTSANIGESLLIQGKLNEALTYMNTALELANKLNKLNVKIRVHNLFFRYYQNKDNAIKALYHFEQFVAAKEEAEKIVKQNETSLKAAQYEYNKQHIADSVNFAQIEKVKNLQLAEQKARLQNEQFQRYGLYGGLLLVLIFAVIIYNRLKFTRKQNEIIEKQRQESEKQKEVIQEKQKEIIDSITYASRLQNAILPQQDFINSLFADIFILYKPKDIIAGDFYWVEKHSHYIFVAAADCTGHGVPGAMVSVVCSNALNAALNEFNITETGKLLDKTCDLVLDTFSRSGSEIKDGMDISLLRIDTRTNEMLNVQWSGANNPMWLISENNLKEIKANKQPIGKFDLRTPFKTHDIKLNKGDRIYLFTDGYADQFGGKDIESRKLGGKKFKYKQLAELLKENCNVPFYQQQQLLNARFDAWKGDLEQIDDVCVIGIGF